MRMSAGFKHAALLAVVVVALTMLVLGIYNIATYPVY